MNEFTSTEDFLKFFKWAKMANPTYNPSEAFLFLCDQLTKLHLQVLQVRREMEAMQQEGDDELD